MPKLQYLHTSHVAERYRVSESTVRRWIKAGKLTARRSDGRWYIRPVDVERFESAHLSGGPDHARG